MLKTLRAYFSYHLQAATLSVNTLFRRPFATLTTVIVIAIALTFPTLFWVFTDNIGRLTVDWQQGGHISLYLHAGNIPEEETALLTKIQSMEGVAQAHLKTRTEGLLELQKQEGMKDVMRYLPENPLPTVIDVIPALTLNTPEKINQLFETIKALPAVEQAKLDMDWIARLYAILGFVSRVTHALMVLLALTVVLIVGNTLRLAIHHRHEEIQVLKLIGATDAFITRPFLYSGIWYGMAGAIFAILFVNIFMLSIAFAVQELAAVYHMHYPLLGLSVKQAYSIVFVATCLGWIGANLSVRRQLSFIEPYK